MRATTAIIATLWWALAGCSGSGRSSQPDARFPSDTQGTTDSGAEASVDRPRIKGGGLLLHWNVDVRWLDSGAGTFAAVALGTSSVEIVSPSSGGYAAARIAPPTPREKDCGVGFPVALAVADLDDDSPRDVGVFDPRCGHWLALRGKAGLQSVNWVDHLPALPSYHFFDAIVWKTAAGPAKGVYAAHAFAITGLIKTATTWRSVGEATRLTPSLTMLVTNLVLPMPASQTGPTQALLQRGQVLQKIVLGDDLTVKEGPFVDQLPDPKYTRGFDGFDHLQPLDDNRCGIAAGVGLFGSAAGRVPRRMQLLSLEGDKVRNLELDTPFEVVTLALAQGVAGNTVVGLVGRDQDRTFFAAGSLAADCGRLEGLRMAAQPLALRTMFADQEKKTVLAPTDGIKMLGRYVEGSGAEFLVYDGFSVFTLRVGTDELETASHVVHADRSDLIWGME